MRIIKYLESKKKIKKKIILDLQKFLEKDKNNFISVFPDVHLKKGEMSPTGCALISAKIFPSFTHLSVGSGISTWSFELAKTFDEKKFIKLFAYLKRKIPGKNLKKKKLNKFNKKDIISFFNHGAKYFIKKNFLSRSDLKNIELDGDFTKAKKLPFSLFDAVPKRIIDESYCNFGTLGTGNTFIELHKISKNYSLKDKTKKKLFLYIHSGMPNSLTKFFCPRWGLHGKDFLPFEREKWKFFSNHLFDKESILAKKNYFPNNSKYFGLEKNSYDGKLYISAMKYLCNISVANRLHHGILIKKYLKKNFGICNLKLENDNVHDSIKEELYKKKLLFVHRHGASPLNKTRNFFVIPSKPGGEVLVAKYINGIEKYGNSICHGTGRKIDRPDALKKFSNNKTLKVIKKNLVKIFYSMKNIAGENPSSFKNLEPIIKILEKKIKFKKLYKTQPIFILKS